MKSSLNFNNSTLPGSLLNLTLNGVTGLINTAEQPSYLGMLFNEQVSNTEPELSLSGLSAADTTNNQLSTSIQQTATSHTTEYSKPRILKATARDISLTLPRLPATVPTECPCKRPKSNIGTQYENDPFVGKTYSKEECRTTGTEAFNNVSVSKNL